MLTEDDWLTSDYLFVDVKIPEANVLTPTRNKHVLVVNLDGRKLDLFNVKFWSLLRNDIRNNVVLNLWNVPNNNLVQVLGLLRLTFLFPLLFELFTYNCHQQETIVGERNTLNSLLDGFQVRIVLLKITILKKITKTKDYLLFFCLFPENCFLVL